jgi:hypothetical protein
MVDHEATEVARPRPPRWWWFRQRLGDPDGTGLVRGIVALWLIGVLIFWQFASPPEAAEELATAGQTLAIAVVAFYFGQRLTGRGEAGPDRVTGSNPSPAPEASTRETAEFRASAALEAMKAGIREGLEEEEAKAEAEAEAAAEAAAAAEDEEELNA